MVEIIDQETGTLKRYALGAASSSTFVYSMEAFNSILKISEKDNISSYRQGVIKTFQGADNSATVKNFFRSVSVNMGRAFSGFGLKIFAEEFATHYKLEGLQKAVFMTTVANYSLLPFIQKATAQIHRMESANKSLFKFISEGKGFDGGSALFVRKTLMWSLMDIKKDLEKSIHKYIVESNISLAKEDTVYLAKISSQIVVAMSIALLEKPIDCVAHELSRLRQANPNLKGNSFKEFKHALKKVDFSLLYRKSLYQQIISQKFQADGIKAFYSGIGARFLSSIVYVQCLDAVFAISKGEKTTQETLADFSKSQAISAGMVATIYPFLPEAGKKEIKAQTSLITRKLIDYIKNPKLIQKGVSSGISSVYADISQLETKISTGVAKLEQIYGSHAKISRHQGTSTPIELGRAATKHIERSYPAQALKRAFYTTRQYCAKSPVLFAAGTVALGGSIALSMPVGYSADASSGISSLFGKAGHYRYTPRSNASSAVSFSHFQNPIIKTSKIKTTETLPITSTFPVKERMPSRKSSYKPTERTVETIAERFIEVGLGQGIE